LMSTAASAASAPPPVPAPRDPKLRRMANALRALAMDAVEQAKSGHPGMPMGMADIASVLFTQFPRFHPLMPDWPARHRFAASNAGDGCMMEGISHEAASLAGHLGLSKLIVLYDDNSISIDGPTELAFSDDPVLRFRAYGWAVERIDGHDHQAIADAIRRAQASDRPNLIACRPVI